MTQIEFSVQTNGKALYEITDDVAQWVSNSGHQTGLLTLFVRHTSCSLLIQENADPSVQTDILNFLDRFAPEADHPDMAYLTHRSEGQDDMPAHLKAMMMPVSLQIPMSKGRLVLGTWQGVYLAEHRSAPHHRRVFGHISA
ncbi:MAG: secondary thiamine-phosphate synthase enzyme YjbQ [Pseudomonadota bacterium]